MRAAAERPPGGGAPADGAPGPRVALVAYHTTSRGTAIFLVLHDAEAPRVFHARDPATGRAVTSEHLQDVARRLLVDFHGLPARWDARADAADYERALRTLPPATPPQQRTFPIRDALLGHPRFDYGLTYWERLSDALLPSALKAAVADCDVLCVVPHGPLHLLPFAALRWAPDAYLIERLGLAVAPSATVLRFCQYRNRARREGAAYRPQSCFVATAATAGDDRELFDADRRTLESLFHAAGGPPDGSSPPDGSVPPDGTGPRDGGGPPVTTAPRMTTGPRVTSLAGAAAGAGVPPASKEMIARHAAGHDVVHLACHGVFGSDLGSADPLDSALVVSDGRTIPALDELPRVSPRERASFLLSAREVFGLDLQADLVTLRACSSGRAEVHSGDELLGLSRAFLYAGSPSLIVALWNVSQRSSRVLLDDFYRLWLDEAEPLPKWAALREAQLRMLRGADAHPYHWAPYVLVGDWL